MAVPGIGNILVITESGSPAALAGVMQRHGHKTIQAHSAAEAVLLAIADTPDLIIIDSPLSEPDAPQLLHILNTLAASSHVPIVATKALPTELRRKGAIAHLSNASHAGTEAEVLRLINDKDSFAKEQDRDAHKTAAQEEILVLLSLLQKASLRQLLLQSALSRCEQELLRKEQAANRQKHKISSVLRDCSASLSAHLEAALAASDAEERRHLLLAGCAVVDHISRLSVMMDTENQCQDRIAEAVTHLSTRKLFGAIVDNLTYAATAFGAAVICNPPRRFPTILLLDENKLIESLRWLANSMLLFSGGSVLEIRMEYDQQMQQLCFALEADCRHSDGTTGEEKQPREQESELLQYKELKQQVEMCGGMLSAAGTNTLSLYRLRFPAVMPAKAASAPAKKAAPQRINKAGRFEQAASGIPAAASGRVPGGAVRINCDTPAVDHAASARQLSAVDFLTAFPAEFKKINSAYHAKAWREVVFKTNKMAGAAALCGFTEIQRVLLSFETRAFPEETDKIDQDLKNLLKVFKERQREFNILGEHDLRVTAPSYSGEAGAVTIVSELVETCPDLISLIAEFLNEVEGYVEGMDGAAQRQDWEQLTAIAHDAAGAAGIYGFPQYRDAANALAGAVKTERFDQVTELLSTLKELTEAIVKGKRYLESPREEE